MKILYIKNQPGRKEANKQRNTPLFSLVTKHLFVLIAAISIHSSAKSQAGEALDFDGALTNYVALPNLVATGSYTIEAWVNARSFVNGGNIVSGYQHAFWAPGGQLSSGHNFSFADVQDPAAMSTGVWYHVAVTYDGGTNVMTLYKNGAVVGTPVAVTPITETLLHVGAYYNGASYFVWDGQIDEVRIWNVVRSGAEISGNQSCILTGDEPGLLAYYNFNQGIAGGSNGAVTTLTDVSDKCVPNNGTLTGFNLTGATSNWVAPGSGVSGSCSGTYPNINVTGNSICITDGDATPSTTDFTDFESNLTRIFTIENTGSATLNITSVTITGTNASEFSVTSAPASSVAAAGSTTFTITFTPASNGTKSAVINITTDDGDETVYNYDIAAAFFTLPVNLKSFTARKDAMHSLLNWTTVTEANNLGFEIQRSNNGTNWSVIGFVAGAGNSNVETSYSFTDIAPAKGVNYYRLKQVDFDNKGKISEIKTVTFALDKTLVYPNPAKDQVIIELPDSRLIGSVAYLTDQQGRLIRQIAISAIQQPVSVSALSPGIYWLKMEDGLTHKLIKQ